MLPWLKGLNKLPASLLGVIQGVLPQAVLMFFLILLPIILRFLAKQQGFVTEMAVELAVQKYYFLFLFVQVFLTVSLSSSIATIVNSIYHGLDSVPTLLAASLPKSSNYFFSYLLLQAFSISAGNLLQITRLIQSLLLAPLVDRTPRQKWNRTRVIPELQWGTLFPIFTNLGCIGKIKYNIVLIKA